VSPLRGPDGRLGVGVPCQRCDPWTPDKVYELHGDVAENVLRRLLVYQNIGGASERRIIDAATAIEQAGSAGEFSRSVTGNHESLWKMGATGTIGLEIALNESVEKRMLDLEVRALEFLWKREEERAHHRPGVDAAAPGRVSPAPIAHQAEASNRSGGGGGRRSVAIGEAVGVSRPSLATASWPPYYPV
jgi:hypothetical protein